MNGLLVDRRRSRLAAVQPDLESAGRGGVFVYDRLHVRDFVRWALRHFRLAVWSSASQRNLQPLVRHVFREHASSLVFVWGQEQCSAEGRVATGRPLAPALGDSGFKPRFLKAGALRATERGALTRSRSWRRSSQQVWAAEGTTRLQLLCSISRLTPCRSTTVLVDDDEYKASRNPPFTALHPPAFDARRREADGALAEAGWLRVYLEFLANAPSVPAHVQRHPLPAEALAAGEPEAEAVDAEAAGGEQAEEGRPFLSRRQRKRNRLQKNAQGEGAHEEGGEEEAEEAPEAA
jgi:hypothetical protein